MTNTPNPQPNTLDEMFEWLDKLSELNKLGGRGHGDLKDVCYICGISPNALKVQLQALITEARNKALDDVKFYGHGYDDGTGFSIKISYEQLNALKLTPKENK